MKLPLERDPSIGRLSTGAIAWKSATPFVENSRGVLIHRPRMVTTHKQGNRDPYLGVNMWCGNTMTGSKKFTFLTDPGHARLVCARCEEKAVAAGLPSSSDIAGRHVHIGGVAAVPACCPR